MAAETRAPEQDELEEDAADVEQYIDQSDVYAEIDDDGDHAMGEDDEDDEVGDLPPSTDTPMEALADSSEQHFTLHTGSVFTVATHPTQSLVVSGGEDDVAYVWDAADGELLVRLSGHTDSVVSASFSADGEMVASGGMDGRVRVWRRVGKADYRTWEFLTELTGPDEVVWLRWHPKGTVLLAGSNDSTLWLWQLPSGNTMQVLAGHEESVQCGEFTPDGKRIVTADAAGTLIYWDPRQPSPLFKLTPADARFAMEGGVTSLAINASSTLAVVGGADGGVRVINLVRGEVVGALAGHAEGESVEAVAFVDLGTSTGGDVVVTGATDGKACIWDVGTSRLRATLEHEDAITTLLPLPAPNAHLLVSASADRTLRTWDARTGALLREHRGHAGAVLGAALGLKGSIVVSAGDDGRCMVFTTEDSDAADA